jgi:lipooligosaccharide transport system ATP-binding protein
MANPAIEIETIRKTYPGGLRAVDDVSCAVPEGSCFGFLGPNGAGKTTLMKMLYGMVRRDADAPSRVNVFGFDPAVESLAIKHLAGVVPQDNNLDGEVDVRTNLYIYGKFYGLAPKEARRRIPELLEFMELGEKAKAKIDELSGGMKRRLVIARALLNQPRLLILDEPTTGLDPQVRQAIWDKIRALKRDGATVLLTTHYMDEAFQIADRIVIMDKGRAILEGPPRGLLAERMEAWLLDVPERAGRELPAENLEGVRREDSGPRSQFFAARPEPLRRIESRLPPGSAYLRPTTLEDLFLRTTGRQLNDGQ